MKFILISLLFLGKITAQNVTTVEELSTALSQAKEGATITLAAGTYKLTQPLDLKSGVAIKGAGIDKTIITNADTWQANPATLPDPETNHEKFDRSGYLIRCLKDVNNVTVSHLTITGPKMHGAIFAVINKQLHFHDLRIANFMYSGIRTYSTEFSKIHDCVFEDAGMRWEKGQPGINGGVNGGGIFAIWIADSEIYNNRFIETRKKPHEHYYGIKGRQGKRLKIHHNTIEVGFSIEFPFENDEDVEIHHNILHHAVSIPKYAGGPVPKSGRTFHIHHNYFRDSYSIEFVRNGVEINHNLFDFNPQEDHGNLIAAFGQAPAKGPALIHNNLINNPGRGVIWMNEPYENLVFRNNHMIARTTKTPRDEGLFGFHEQCNFASFQFTDNIIECQEKARPLFRNNASAKSLVENNQLSNISDTARYGNKKTEKKAGLEEPLRFQCGVNGELTVEGWKTKPTAKK